MTDSEIKPFKIDIPVEEVERLKRKLTDTRLPGREIVPGAGNRYAKDLYDSWKDEYDWFFIQKEINEFPHYLAEIEGIKIHFLHVRAERPDAILLLLVHGWPGSFWEFSQVWGPLSHPKNSTEPAFHCVVPSMPGFCWSDWPPKAGWTLQDNARIFDAIMKKLGYNEYMIQFHFNFTPNPLPDGIGYTEREKAVSARVDDWNENHIGYAVCMRTRPQTLGIALNDNPLGILMFVGEKFIEASDPKSQKRPFWTKAILTTATLYYFTSCIMPSMLPYYENVQHHKFNEFSMKAENRIVVPFGYTSFFWGTEPSSKRAVERTGNLVFYKERDNAGHFAVLENPTGLVEDVRALALQEWK